MPTQHANVSTANSICWSHVVLAQQNQICILMSHRNNSVMFSTTHTATISNKEYKSLSQSHMGGGRNQDITMNLLRY